MHENKGETIESQVKDGILDESSTSNGYLSLKGKNAFAARLMDKNEVSIKENFVFCELVFEVCLTIFKRSCIIGLRAKSSEI